MYKYCTLTSKFHYSTVGFFSLVYMDMASEKDNYGDALTNSLSHLFINNESSDAVDWLPNPLFEQGEVIIFLPHYFCKFHSNLFHFLFIHSFMLF